MTWTTERPTEPGWYWRKMGQSEDWYSVVVVEFCQTQDGLGYLAPGFHSIQWPENDKDAEWSGPLRPPGEADDVLYRTNFDLWWEKHHARLEGNAHMAALEAWGAFAGDAAHIKNAATFERVRIVAALEKHMKDYGVKHGYLTEKPGVRRILAWLKGEGTLEGVEE